WAGEDAVGGVQESDRWLGGIVSVHHCRGPTAEAGDGFEFGALQREVVLGEAEPRGERQCSVRLVRRASHVIGHRGIETAVEAGISRAGKRKRVQSVELVGLSEQEVYVSAAIELGGILNARI